MRTLFRLIVILCVLAGIGYGVLLALATFVEPRPRDMSYSLPSDRLHRDEGALTRP